MVVRSRSGGLDPRRDRDRLRQILGMQLQESALAEKLKVGEALELYASFYEHPADQHELLGSLGLQDKLSTRYGKLSGGQKPRLSIALALPADRDPRRANHRA
jgi:ABC-2 type transport system ATP-binding protein